MTDQQDPRNEQYDRVRDAFDSLPIEDKTVFLLKETVNTIVQSVEGAARSIIDEFEGIFGEAPAADAETETQEKAAAEDGAAKTSTTRKKTTASKGRSTTRKTTAKKTTSSRKKTSPRKTTKKDDSEDA